MAQINTCLRQPLVEWADKYGMLIRRLRSDRFLVVLNEKIYQQVVEDKFAILNTVRKNAEDIDEMCIRDSLRYDKYRPVGRHVAYVKPLR